MDEIKNDEHLEDHGDIISLIPTIDVVVFPQMVVPLLVTDEKIINGINEAMDNDKRVLLLAARTIEESEGQRPIGAEDLYVVGTIGKIMRVMNLPDGGLKVLVQGIERGIVEEIMAEDDVLRARVEVYPFEDAADKKALEQQMREAVTLCERISSVNGNFSPDFHVIFSQIDDPERAIDFLLSHMTLAVDQLQGLLESLSLEELLSGLCEYLGHEIESNKVKEKIRHHARDAISKSQREYYLREQLRAIQRELGEESDVEFEDLKLKIENTPLTQEALDEANRQLRRLERTSPDSLEASVIRNHLEWLLGMPWGNYTADNLSLGHARDILNNKHYGLDSIKDRILDFLSVRTFKAHTDTPILCFSGPAGVGKTSLGRSIAECLGRNFFRISLGGVHDESEIRGHRRTYVGALPGRIVQAISKAGSSNPVIMIDEIDKAGNSGRGDPSAALLEVLDPEQNGTFYDNYLGVHYDLSRVMFITTANDIGAISGPLRDRMEVIELSGYTTDEKVHIAKRHLLNRAVENAGLEGKGFDLNDDLIREVVDGYTRESGVRDLDRSIRKLCSKFARSLIETEKATTFTKENISSFLGPRRIAFKKQLLEKRIGVTNGLAWTPYGGVVLQVEAVLMPGDGKLTLTGQLGDVMRESAQAAISYVRSHADLFGIKRELFTNFDLHIHVPAGAVPKDGPSAGITLLTSVVSAYTKRPIDGSFAMTGEVDLQGGVLPIGGLREKILAAKRDGLECVIAPQDNQHDLAGMEELLGGIRLIFVNHIDQVIQHVLLPL